MDNRREIPGYKVYLAPDGSRPACHVCFLDIHRDPGARVAGLCIAVDPAVLRVLDVRERNYDRIEVSDVVRGAPPGARVWTYVGSAAGRARLRAGRAAGTAVVARDYLDTVRDGLRLLADAARAEAGELLDSAPIPVAELVRRDLA